MWCYSLTSTCRNIRSLTKVKKTGICHSNMILIYYYDEHLLHLACPCMYEFNLKSSWCMILKVISGGDSARPACTTVKIIVSKLNYCNYENSMQWLTSLIPRPCLPRLVSCTLTHTVSWMPDYSPQQMQWELPACLHHRRLTLSTSESS